MADPRDPDDMTHVKVGDIHKYRETIKDLRYLVNRLTAELEKTKGELKAARDFPDTVIKAAAEKILLSKTLKKEAMARWKKTDE